MLAFEVTLNIYIIISLAILSFATGFIFRSGQLRYLKSKIFDLEKEMLSNHADILELQKENANLERTLKQSQIPVIPIKSPKEENADVAQDVSLRKKLLGQRAQKQS